MKKEEIIKGCIALIKHKAEKLNLTITDKGTGHDFDGTVWKDILPDTSNIPNIIAYNDDYSIELRSFWGDPEIDIRKGAEHHILQIFNYSDYFNGEHTGEFYINQIRVDSGSQIKGNITPEIEEIMQMIKFIEEKIKE